MSIVKVKVYEKGIFDDVPTNAKDFMLFFQEKLDSIPSEFKDSAEIEIEANPYYDSAILGIEMYYFRPKTDSELKADAEIQARQLEESKRRKLAEFERLKRELGL